MRREAGEICRSGAHGDGENGQNQVPRRCRAPRSRLRALTRPSWSPALLVLRVRVTGAGLPGMRERHIERRPRASASAIALLLRATRVRPSLCRCASTCLHNVLDCLSHPGTRSWPGATPLELWER